MKTDSELQRDVLDELKWEPSVDAAHIGVAVKDGIVTLSGHVPSYAQKYAAERAAKRVYGVRAVANELEVKLPGSSRRTDEDIAAAAANALKASVSVPADKIKVIVSDGVVKLEGDVEWQYQRDAAARRPLPARRERGNQPDHGQAPPHADGGQVEDRGRSEAQRRDGRPPHHRRGRRRQGDPARQRALVGRKRGGRAGGLGGTGSLQRREPHHRHAVTAMRRDGVETTTRGQALLGPGRHTSRRCSCATDVPAIIRRGGQRTGHEIMAVKLKLNKRAFEHTRELIGDRRVVLDERDAWSEHQPSAERENEFIRLHGFDEYGKWYLGIDEEKGEQTKGRYKFPYGDFEKVHRCAVLAAESRAGQYKYRDIENAAAHLHGMIEQMKQQGGEKD
jgi:BON domain